MSALDPNTKFRDSLGVSIWILKEKQMKVLSILFCALAVTTLSAPTGFAGEGKHCKDKNCDHKNHKCEHCKGKKKCDCDHGEDKHE